MGGTKSMYTPSFYRETRSELIYEVIENYGFGTLLSLGGDDSISHLPFVLDTSITDKPVLLGHMARANPHWRTLEKTGKAKVLFQGPHGYISPAWYQPSPDNVPTWNYAVVHVTGKFEVVSDFQAAYKDMKRLVEKFEGRYQTGWTLPQAEPAIEELLKHITIFQLHELEFSAKFKLSQKLNSENREGTIAGLKKVGANALSHYMELAVAVDQGAAGGVKNARLDAKARK